MGNSIQITVATTVTWWPTKSITMKVGSNTPTSLYNGLSSSINFDQNTTQPLQIVEVTTLQIIYMLSKPNTSYRFLYRLILRVWVELFMSIARTGQMHLLLQLMTLQYV